MPEKVSILLDGGFIKKKLEGSLQRFPNVTDVQDLRDRVMRHSRVSGKRLFRLYYYDAPSLRRELKAHTDFVF